MPTTYKVLGQSNPSATSATTLYTVPSTTQAVVSTITVCNQASSAATYRIAVRPNGDTLAAQHYVAYDVSLPGNATDTLTLGITLGDTDVITVYASTATMSFNAYGSEIA
jgi:glucose-6-phosphate dehydrogenase assembly protein OpcA